KIRHANGHRRAICSQAASFVPRRPAWDLCKELSMSDVREPSNPASAVSRRDFLAASAGVISLPLVELAGADEKSVVHHIPADKQLDPAWLKQLFAKGEPKVYRGDELTCIGMPIGGICAGQLYLTGDGTLAEWNIFNVDHFTGYGDTCYRTYAPPKPLQQG